MALRLVLPIWSLDMSKNKCPIIFFVVAFFILCQSTSYGQKVEVGLLSSPRSVGIAIDVGSRSSNTSLVRLYTDLYEVISGKYQTPGVKADYHITFQLAEKTFSDGTRARVIVGPGVCTGYARVGEYAEQLETDGAESIIGKIHFVETDDSYDVVVNEMEIVPSEDYDKGYYIANSNLEVTFDFGLDCRVVCDGEDGPVVVTADDFFKDYNDDNKALYCVYYFGDQAELILAVHPKDEI